MRFSGAFQSFLISFCLPLLLVLATAQAALSAPRVTVSIKPLHGIVSAVMEGVSTPQLLLDANSSPHDATLKPSQAEALEQAGLIVWIGPDMEGFLDKPINALTQSGTKARLLTALEISGLSFPGAKDAEKSGSEEAGHGDHDHDHAHSRDAHIWLDPQNGLAIAGQVAKILSEMDPANAATYLANTAKLTAEIFDLERELKEQLAVHASQPFITFHEGYGHFYNRFGLTGGQAISFNPEVKPGAARVRSLQALVSTRNIRCVFSEPQFDSSTARLIVGDARISLSSLDPLGGALEAGPKHYPLLLRTLASAIADCLKAS